MKKEKIIITILSLLLIVFLIGGYFIYDNLNQKNNELSTKVNELEQKVNTPANEDKNNKSDEESTTINNYQDYLNSLISNVNDQTLWNNNDNSIVIKLSKKGKLTYKASFLEQGEESIKDQIVYAKEVKKGTDTCDGDSWIVYITSTGNVRALSIDNLECGEKVKIVDLSSLKEITEIYSTQNNISTENVDGTKTYDIFAKNYNGETIKINDLLS